MVPGERTDRWSSPSGRPRPVPAGSGSRDEERQPNGAAGSHRRPTFRRPEWRRAGQPERQPAGRRHMRSAEPRTDGGLRQSSATRSCGPSGRRRGRLLPAPAGSGRLRKVGTVRVQTRPARSRMAARKASARSCRVRAMTRDELILATLAGGDASTAALSSATGLSERTCRYGTAHLIKAGYIWSPERGRWRLTEAGRAIVAELGDAPGPDRAAAQATDAPATPTAEPGLLAAAALPEIGAAPGLQPTSPSDTGQPPDGPARASGASLGLWLAALAVGIGAILYGVARRSPASGPLRRRRRPRTGGRTTGGKDGSVSCRRGGARRKGSMAPTDRPALRSVRVAPLSVTRSLRGRPLRLPATTHPDHEAASNEQRRPLDRVRVGRQGGARSGAGGAYPLGHEPSAACRNRPGARKPVRHLFDTHFGPDDA